MFEIWDGDLFLFTVDFKEEADMLREEGYKIREVDLS